MARDKVALVLFVGCVLALSAFGLVMLYSVTADVAGERLLQAQVRWLLLGVLGGSLVYLGDYRWLARRSLLWLLLISLPLGYLATVHLLSILPPTKALVSHLPFIRGEINGAWRWLNIGGFSVQPSEFARLCIFIYLAQYYGTNPRYASSFRRGLWEPLWRVGLVTVAILLGGSLSVTAITGAVVLGMLFVAGIRLRYFIVLGLAAVMLVAVVVQVSPARMQRLISFRNPEAFAQAEGYQLWQSQKALGSGSWLGVGLNKSHMKELYLPEAHTDFILSIAGEELGYLVLLGVILGYLVLVGSGCYLATRAPDRVGMLLGFALMLAIGLNAFVNLGVVSGLLPTTGITAPFISYGGSSLICTFVSVGLMLNIVRQSQRQEVAVKTPGTLPPLGRGLRLPLSPAIPQGG